MSMLPKTQSKGHGNKDTETRKMLIENKIEKLDYNNGVR